MHKHVHYPYSFLDGASSLEALLRQADQWEMPALAITDHSNVRAAVEFHKLSQVLGIKPIQGAEITTEDGTHLTLLAEYSTGYLSLCRLSTSGVARGSRHQCLVPGEALRVIARGLIALSGGLHSGTAQALLRRDYAQANLEALRLLEISGPWQVYL